jgi:hypothetical protein
MQQTSFKLPRFDFILLARELIDHRHSDHRAADPVPQLRGQIPLDLFAAQGPDSLKQRTDFEFRAGSANNTRRGRTSYRESPLFMVIS